MSSILDAVNVSANKFTTGELMNIRNIDDAPYSPKHGSYGGESSIKDGVVIDGEYWIIKYPRNTSYLKNTKELSYTLDPLSEYLGSRIYKILGIPVHETMLVERRGKIAVACKDFIDDTRQQKLLEIRTIKNAANEQLAEMLEQSFNNTSSSHIVELEELLLHFKYNDILSKVDGIYDRFFDMVIIDILINNSDRNNGNWGIIREPGCRDSLAPVFDNGGSFNGKTPDSRLKRILDDSNELKNNILGCRTTFGKDGISYTPKALLSLDIPELKQAITRNVPNILKHEDEIIDLIQSLPLTICSEIRKEFYIKTIEVHIDYIFKPIYESIVNQEELTKGGNEMNIKRGGV